MPVLSGRLFWDSELDRYAIVTEGRSSDLGARAFQAIRKDRPTHVERFNYAAGKILQAHFVGLSVGAQSLQLQM